MENANRWWRGRRGGAARGPGSVGAGVASVVPRLKRFNINATLSIPPKRGENNHPNPYRLPVHVTGGVSRLPPGRPRILGRRAVVWVRWWVGMVSGWL